MSNNKKIINPAAEALKKPNPFADGTFDGTTKLKEGAGYNPHHPNEEQIQIIDDEAFQVPANNRIVVPDPDDPNEAIEIDNKSRGKVGYVSNPEKIAELKAQGIPINDNAPSSPSVQELQKRFDDNKQNKANQQRIRQEKAKKGRLKIQHAAYNPPEDLKDVPGLAPYNPNEDDIQNTNPQADSSLGEIMLEDNTGQSPQTPGTATGAGGSTAHKKPKTTIE